MTPKFLRKGHIIRTLHHDENGNVTGFSDQEHMGRRHHKHDHMPSNSAAKRASRELQKQHGPGSLQVVTKFPAVEA